MAIWESPGRYIWYQPEDRVNIQRGGSFRGAVQGKLECAPGEVVFTAPGLVVLCPKVQNVTLVQPPRQWRTFFRVTLLGLVIGVAGWLLVGFELGLLFLLLWGQLIRASAQFLLHRPKWIVVDYRDSSREFRRAYFTHDSDRWSGSSTVTKHIFPKIRAAIRGSRAKTQRAPEQPA